ncbi:MAG: serine/threonine protein kinase, partial [Nevskiales bacterium]
MEHKNALPIGHRIEDYEIESILGHGGFGITYKARDLSLGSHVAIKEYLPQELAIRDRGLTVSPKSAGDADSYRWGLDRFLEEARTLARFKHANIVRVVRYLQANNTGYTVMDFEEGKTLSSHLLSQTAAMTEQAIIEVFMPIMDGLREVHALGLLHRDIKPGNIYLRSNGSPMLIDFGAARQAVGERSKSLSVIVTQGYAPLEQYSSRGKQGAWSDIYALGATMHRCISGAEPIEASVRLTAMMDQEPDPLPPATEIGKSRYSEPLLQAIDWALQVRAQERPQNVEEFQRAIQGVAAPPVTSPGTRLLVPQTTLASAAAASARASGALSAAQQPAAPQSAPQSAITVGINLSRKALLLGLLVLVVLPALAVGGKYLWDELNAKRYAEDDQLFTTAQAADTEAAYREYLKTCDACRHKALAEQAVDDKLFLAAKAADSVEAYLQYSKTCTGCQRKVEALQAADEKQFATAIAAASIDPLNDYIKNCVTCARKAEAEQRVARKTKELAAMERVKGMGNVRRVILVLEGYAGNCANTVRSELRGIGLTSVSENDDYDAYLHASISTPVYFQNAWAAGYKARYSVTVKRIGDGKVLLSRSGSELGSSARDNCDDAAEQIADDI